MSDEFRPADNCNGADKEKKIRCLQLKAKDRTSNIHLVSNPTKTLKWLQKSEFFHECKWGKFYLGSPSSQDNLPLRKRGGQLEMAVSTYCLGSSVHIPHWYAYFMIIWLCLYHRFYKSITYDQDLQWVRNDLRSNWPKGISCSADNEIACPEHFIFLVCAHMPPCEANWSIRAYFCLLRFW